VVGKQELKRECSSLSDNRQLVGASHLVAPGQCVGLVFYGAKTFASQRTFR
jgi:hypothetical protein